MRRRAERVLLSSLKPGQSGRVVSYLHPEQPAMRRLAVLGFLPGEFFTLELCRPDYLIRFGYTRVAINKKIARNILVYKMALPFGKR